MTTDFAPIDALAIGVNVVDVLVRLPDHFTPGEKQPARDLVVHGGGPAATAACVLAALGWRTGFVTRLSDDPLGFVGLLVRTPSWFIEAAMGFGALANLETGSHVLAANWLALRFVKLQIFICDRHEQ